IIKINRNYAKYFEVNSKLSLLSGVAITIKDHMQDMAGGNISHIDVFVIFRNISQYFATFRNILQFFHNFRNFSQILKCLKKINDIVFFRVISQDFAILNFIYYTLFIIHYILHIQYKRNKKKTEIKRKTK